MCIRSGRWPLTAPAALVEQGLGTTLETGTTTSAPYARGWKGDDLVRDPHRTRRTLRTLADGR